ncbi:hypothetical protein [Roseateles sp.]|uniref:hypothetical protein n=1 Tax=Roseateles sp. TaxID=1971397 RepID=UPI0032658324
MKHVLLALGALLLACAVMVICVSAFLLFDLQLGPVFAFWPGFAAQWVLEQLGVSMPNRALLWITLAFWWSVCFLALLVRRNAQARAAQPFAAGDGFAVR